MANAYSIRADYGEVVNPINLDLVATVLQAKQQKHDKNVLAIDTMLAEYGNIDLARDSDREYLYSKLQNLTEQVNTAGKLDLSNGNVTRSIQSHISQALDPHVIKQIGITQQIKKYNQDAATRKEKNDGSYSDKNYQVGLMKAGYLDYMNNKTNDLKPLNYTPYINVQEILSKDIEKYKSSQQPIQYRDGQGNIIEVKDLTPLELRNYAMSKLDSNAKAQLEIDGYAQYGGLEEEIVNQYATSFYEGSIESIDNQIASVKFKMKNGTTPVQQQVLSSALSDLQNQKISLTNNFSSSTSKDQKMQFLAQEEAVNNLINAHAFESMKYLKDDAFWQQKNYDLAVEKLNISKLELELKQREVLGVDQIATIPSTTPSSEDIDRADLELQRLLEQPKMEVMAGFSTMEANILDPNSEYSTTKVQIGNKEMSMTDVYNKIKNEKFKDVSDPVMRQKLIFDDFKAQTGVVSLQYEIINRDGQREIVDMEDITENYLKQLEAYETVTKTVNEDVWGENIERVYNELTGRDLRQQYGVDSNGNTISLKDYTRGYSRKEFEENKDGVQDLVKQNLYGQHLLKTLYEDTQVEGMSQANRIGFRADSNKLVELKQNIDRLNTTLNSKDIPDDVFEFFVTDRTTGQFKPANYREAMESERGARVKIKRGTKVSDLLSNLNSKREIQNSLSPAMGFTDVSKITNTDLEDLSDVLSFNMTTQRKTKLAGALLAAKESNDAMIRPDKTREEKGIHTPFSKLRDYMTVASPSTAAAINDDNAFLVRSAGGNQVTIYQRSTTGVGDKREASLKSLGVFDKAIVEQQIGVRLEIDGGNPILTQSKPYVAESVNLISGKTEMGLKRVDYLMQEERKGKLLRGASVLTTEENIINSLSTGFGLEKGGNEERVVKTAINNIENFRVEVNPSSEMATYNTVKVSYSQNGVYIPLKIFKVNKVNPYNVVQNTARKAPQYYVHNYLFDVIRASKGNDQEPIEELIRVINGNRSR